LNKECAIIIFSKSSQILSLARKIYYEKNNHNTRYIKSVKIQELSSLQFIYSKNLILTNYNTYSILRNRDISFDVATTLCWMAQESGFDPERSNNFFLIHSVQTGLGTYLASLLLDTGVLTTHLHLVPKVPSWNSASLFN
jgi:hypothetical protein